MVCACPSHLRRKAAGLPGLACAGWSVADGHQVRWRPTRSPPHWGLVNPRSLEHLKGHSRRVISVDIISRLDFPRAHFSLCSSSCWRQGQETGGGAQGVPEEAGPSQNTCHLP